MYTPHLEVPNGTNSNIRLLQNEGSIEGRLLVGQRRCVRPPAGPLKSASIHPVHMTPTNPSLQEAMRCIISEQSYKRANGKLVLQQFSESSHSNPT